MAERRSNNDIVRDIAEKEAKIKEKMRKAEMNVRKWEIRK